MTFTQWQEYMKWAVQTTIDGVWPPWCQQPPPGGWGPRPDNLPPTYAWDTLEAGNDKFPPYDKIVELARDWRTCPSTLEGYTDDRLRGLGFKFYYRIFRRDILVANDIIRAIAERRNEIEAAKPKPVIVHERETKVVRGKKQPAQV